jgi:hypothetical protein
MFTITDADLKLLRSVWITMGHAQIFISSRERMHADGQELYRLDMDALATLVQRLEKEAVR